MSTKIKYNGVETSIANGHKVTIPCKDKKMTDDVVITVEKQQASVKAQSKTVTPTKGEQDVFPDEGYTHLSQVTVKPIPDKYIVPGGELKITGNGTYDVTGFARVIIEVGGGSSTISVYMANNPDESPKYALSGVEANMTWREWIDATDGYVAEDMGDGWIWIDEDEGGLWCGSWAEIYNSNGDLQTPDSVMVDGATYYSNEIFC